MDALLRVHGGTDPHTEFVSLRQWLSGEPEFRGRVGLALAAPREGEMGPVADTLVVAVGSGGALTVLAGTVGVWLQQRRSSVSVEIVGPDGAIKRISASGRAADVLADTIAERTDDS